MKKTFFAGLAILLPIAITIFIVMFVADLFTAPFAGFAENTISYYGGTIAEQHRYILVFVSRVAVLFLLFFATLILGFVGRRFFFSYLLKVTDRILNKIPFVKFIYRISLDVTKNVFSGDKKKLFHGTVLVPFPHEKTSVLGLLSGNPPVEVQKHVEKELKSIFIPTAPHPISGFLVMYSQDEIKTIDIATEDVFKFLISCGTYQPPGPSDDKK